jgi:hypothetical protein
MICRNIHNLPLSGPITITYKPRCRNTKFSTAPTSRTWLIPPRKCGTRPGDAIRCQQADASKIGRIRDDHRRLDRSVDRRPPSPF